MHHSHANAHSAIFTYNQQGVLKAGVHAEHHAVIYTGTEPAPLAGEVEKGLTRQSIKMSYKDPRHKLDKMSRLNYAKLYTIEHNVKVWFIGHISKDWERQVKWDYDQSHPPMLPPSTSIAPPAAPELFSHAHGGYDPEISDDIQEVPEPVEDNVSHDALHSRTDAGYDDDDLYRAE